MSTLYCALRINLWCHSREHEVGIWRYEVQFLECPKFQIVFLSSWIRVLIPAVKKESNKKRKQWFCICR